MGEWTRKKSNVQNENNNDINVNYEISQLIKIHQINNISYTILGLIYQQKPIHFNYLCPYEFYNKTNKINNISCHRFNNEHLQYNTHNHYEFKVPKTPILQFVLYLHHGIQILTSN
jgi:hypothetical protein